MSSVGGAPALVLRGLTKRFGRKVAVDRVELTVPRGSFFGLVGPNGAGKTTTLSMAVGLLRPDDGRAHVLGVDVWGDTRGREEPARCSSRRLVAARTAHRERALDLPGAAAGHGTRHGARAGHRAARGARARLGRGHAGDRLLGGDAQEDRTGRRTAPRAQGAGLHGRRALFFSLSAVLGAVAGLVSMLLPLAAGVDLEAGTDVVAAVGAVWALGWLVGPLLSGGGDETLRPENFALLPIRPRPLAAGLLAASVVGVGPAATLLALGAVVTLGVSFGGLPAVVAVMGLALELAFVVAASQVVLAGLGAVIASRRGRDIGVVLASLVGLALLPLQWLFNAVGPVVLERRSPVLSTVLRAVPSGWSAVAVRAAVRGDLLWTVAPLVGLALLVAALLGAWAPLLRRRMTVSSTAGAATGPAGRARPAETAPSARSVRWLCASCACGGGTRGGVRCC